MDLQKYIDMENAPIPADVAEKFAHAGSSQITKFEDKNEILTTPSLHHDIGYTQMNDGNYIVSSWVYLKGITAEMVQWWFWWHPLATERYILWYPGEHFGISYPKEEESYFNQKKFPGFQPNVQYPIERIGGKKMPLSLEFMTPEDFGYDKKLMEENNVATIVCAHVGAFKDHVPHTEMSHVCFQKEDGLLMVNRFWIGQRAKNPMIRKMILTDETAKGMGEHCYVEYHNFANKIPQLYAEYLEEVGED